MNLPVQIFREYDIRGLVDTELTEALAEQLGRAVGTTLRRNQGQSLIVGRDHRASGVALSRGLISGLRQCGCDVIDIGITPNPGQLLGDSSFTSRCIQITGSHNPPEYNGFKMTLQGKSLYGDDIRHFAAS
ncbi:MAG: hypothetical protein R3C68_17250 [Myxococcota bacterium]